MEQFLADNLLVVGTLIVGLLFWIAWNLADPYQ